ncbi:hypothetical protein [Planktothricoides raciborskii]|uniref:hypothetical protein n=1 Tax=Planktothricoides raciborskii TaxID=132608 RepID=UPI00168658EA|nr:hypothetical protein [Planktothricoides raciborskii]MBD2582897.1 hypothetical protein [Planktothricoides raciborskii FACHB-1261]
MNTKTPKSCFLVTFALIMLVESPQVLAAYLTLMQALNHNRIEVCVPKNTAAR